MTKQLKIFLFALFVILSIANISFAASADGKVQIDYYWGDGCGHCEAIKPFLDDFEQRHKDDVNMVRHEVWKHPDEAQKFNDMMDVYGVPQNRRGTPTLIVNGTLLVGGQEIPQRLEQEVVKAKLGKGAKEDDAVNNLLKGMPNGKAPEVNAPAKAGHCSYGSCRQCKSVRHHGSHHSSFFSCCHAEEQDKNFLYGSIVHLCRIFDLFCPWSWHYERSCRFIHRKSGNDCCWWHIYFYRVGKLERRFLLSLRKLGNRDSRKMEKLDVESCNGRNVSYWRVQRRYISDVR